MSTVTAPTVRAFVGLPMPEAYQEQLANVRAVCGSGLRSKVSWIQKGNWHLTLKFLGESTHEQLDALTGELRKIAFAPFVFQAGGAGMYPSPKSSGAMHPRVLWVGVRQGEGPVRSLAEAVEAAAVTAAYDRNDRKFSPHLTLARIKSPAADPWDRVLATIRTLDWTECAMDRFVLWKSVLGPEGPAYTVLQEFPALA